MPKEVIKALRDQQNDTLRVEVGWQRMYGSVQIASLNPEAGDSMFAPERGWFVHLDRDGVNKLIRSLRKARDQAFGADA